MINLFINTTKIILVTAAVSAVGCTSAFQVLENAPVKVDTLNYDGDEVIGTVSLAAKRRTVIVSLQGENKGKFCAEPPPEVAENITSEVSAEIKAKLETLEESKAEGEAKIKDVYVTTSVPLSERTVLLDIYRTGTYSLCQYHLNGALSDGELKEEFRKLTDGVLSKLSPK